MDLVVLGHVAIDHVIFPDKREIILHGGAATAVATSAALSGAKVGLVTKIGKDFPKEWLNRLSEILDIKGVHILEGNTIHIYMIYHEDGSVDAPVDMGVAQKMGETEIPEEYLNAKIFHISPIPPEEQLKVINRLKGKRISLDFNPTYMEDYKTKKDLMKEIISRTEIIFPNEREARTITGEKDLKKAAKILYEWGANLTIITLGEKGALLYNGEKFMEFEALPINEIVDPTGAGDAFAGGFLAHYAKEKPIEKCIKQGLLRAREVLKKKGSWSIEV
ncbi:MAG: carbohydrate kinase family protein [Thermococcus sp.]|uniref:carbohydrate kinase family protein n=1 Tax=Thermococcus sp. TaxID=35749 RepID=UPI002627E90D|nr:carbohydrate kinase family protein [Thermococcus sp.]MCD6140709.1 carbohydrate kinase family protein [Thermococcus sp.]